MVEAPPTELPQPTLQACMPVAPAVPHRWNAWQLAGFSHQAGCEAGPGTSRTFGGLSSSRCLSKIFPFLLIDLVQGQFLVEALCAELPQPTLQACMPVFPAVPHRWNARQLAGFFFDPA